jgi:hypothetical protein
MAVDEVDDQRGERRRAENGNGFPQQLPAVPPPKTTLERIGGRHRRVRRHLSSKDS